MAAGGRRRVWSAKRPAERGCDDAGGRTRGRLPADAGPGSPGHRCGGRARTHANTRSLGPTRDRRGGWRLTPGGGARRGAAHAVAALRAQPGRLCARHGAYGCTGSCVPRGPLDARGRAERDGRRPCAPHPACVAPLARRAASANACAPLAPGDDAARHGAQRGGRAPGARPCLHLRQPTRDGPPSAAALDRRLGRGFGPPRAVAQVPRGGPATGLWKHPERGRCRHLGGERATRHPARTSAGGQRQIRRTASLPRSPGPDLPRGTCAPRGRCDELHLDGSLARRSRPLPRVVGARAGADHGEDRPLQPVLRGPGRLRDRSDPAHDRPGARPHTPAP